MRAQLISGLIGAAFGGGFGFLLGLLFSSVRLILIGLFAWIGLLMGVAAARQLIVDALASEK